MSNSSVDVEFCDTIDSTYLSVDVTSIYVGATYVSVDATYIGVDTSLLGADNFANFMESVKRVEEKLRKKTRFIQ